MQRKIITRRDQQPISIQPFLMWCDTYLNFKDYYSANNRNFLMRIENLKNVEESSKVWMFPENHLVFLKKKNTISSTIYTI